MDNNIKVTIDQLYEYLKSLNENEELNTDKINLDELLDNIDNQDIILILDHDISEEEIVLAVNKHNNGKASVDDEIINEYLKREVNQFLPIYVKLLNLIFSSGIKSYSWVVGIIKPMYKNKGDPITWITTVQFV
jgi:recombinational DNA repair protein RecR